MASTDMDQKLRDEILKSLMWDYSIPITELSKLIDGTIQEAGGMTRELFFLRCLERVPWHNLVPLWHGTKNFTSIRRKSEEDYEPTNSVNILISSSDYYEGKGYKRLNGAPRIVKN
nr:hypothetical protein [Treponema socranskii]